MGKIRKYSDVREWTVSIPHSRHLADAINSAAGLIFSELDLDYSSESRREGVSWLKAVKRATDRITFSLRPEIETDGGLSEDERIRAGQMLSYVAAVKLVSMRDVLEGTTLRSAHSSGIDIGGRLVSEFKRLPFSLQKTLVEWWEADSPNSEVLAEELFKFQGYNAETAHYLARGVSFLMRDPHEIELATRLPVRYGFLVLKNARMIMDLVTLKTKKYLQEPFQDQIGLRNISSDRVLRELVSLGLVLREGDPQDVSYLGEGLGLEYIVQVGTDIVKEDFGRHKIHNLQIGIMRAYAKLVGGNSILPSSLMSSLPNEFLSMIHMLDRVMERERGGK